MENTEQIKKTRSKVYRRYNWASITILLQLIVSNVAVMAAQSIISISRVAATGEKIPLSADFNMVLTGIANVLVNTLLAIFVLKITKTGKLSDSFKKPGFSVTEIVMVVFMCLGLTNINELIVNSLSVVFDSSTKYIASQLGSGISSNSIILSVSTYLYISILGPIAEELLLRGCVLRLGSHVSPKVGVFASALLFGILHGNITQFYNTFLMGLLLGYMTVKCRSIIPAIIAHICNNSLATVMTFIKPALGPDNYKTFNLIYTWAIIAVGIVCAFFILRKYKMIDDAADKVPVNLPATEEEIEQAKNPSNPLKFKALFSTWAFWLVVVIGIAMFVLMAVAGMMMK